MERINDYGVHEVVCDHCRERIYDSDELVILGTNHYHGWCYLEWKGNDDENIPDMVAELQRGDGTVNQT